MTIGERLKKAIDNSSFSRTEISMKANISKQTLYKYENGIVTNIPSDKIEILSKILDVSPAYLMGWDQEEINAATEMMEDVFHAIEEKERQFMKDISDLDLSDEELDDVLDYARYIKSKNGRK